MLSKETIKRTVVCSWSENDGCFVAESSMFPRVVAGLGESREEAIREFEAMLNSAYQDLEKDNVAGYSAGRPVKGYVALNCNLRPSSKERLEVMAKELRISQGEAVDFLLFFYDRKTKEIPQEPDKDELTEKLNSMKTELVKLVEKVNTLGIRDGRLNVGSSSYGAMFAAEHSSAYAPGLIASRFRLAPSVYTAPESPSPAAADDIAAPQTGDIAAP